MARILIIDDDALVRQVLKDWLEPRGHEVIEAENGNVGLALFRENPAELVITDIVMPDKEGIETIRELRRDFPDAKIIAVSGGGQLMPGSTCLTLAEGLGVQRTLAKPVNLMELSKTISEILDS
jgi:YesN/AraC family two-component response regulator